MDDNAYEYQLDAPTIDQLQKMPEVQDSTRFLLLKVPLALRTSYYERGGEVFDELTPYRKQLYSEIGVRLTDPQWIAALAGVDEDLAKSEGK
jgi:hypothetical protein